MSVNSERVSRRFFLATGAAVLADSLLFQGTAPDVKASDAIPSPVIHAEVTAEAMSARFNVTFLNPSDPAESIIVRRSGCEPFAVSETLLPWQASELGFLGGVMERLPSGMYAPAMGDDNIRHYLEIARVDYPKPTLPDTDTPKSRSRHLRLGGGRHVVVLSNNRLISDEKVRVKNRKVIVHELAHYRSSLKRQFYIETICQPVGVGTINELQELFDSELLTHEEEDTDDCGIPNGITKIKLKHKSRIGYGATDYGEFFSVASEYFFEGEKEFRQAYRSFFRKKTGLFYDLMQEHIFDGVEYNR